MKLIITGGSGFVGTEVIRQALNHKAITSVIALSRKPIATPENVSSAPASKLQTIILEDWTTPYPDSVKEQLKGADACIWNLAVTPMKSREMDPAEVSKICFDYTVNGLENIAAVANNPFRFVYTSGVMVERDQSKTPPMLPEYTLMRGRVETAVLDFAKQRAPAVQAAITKPGAIEGPGHPKSEEVVSAFKKMGDIPWLHVSELAATMIDQCLNDITKDTWWPKEIEERGAALLPKSEYVAAGPS